jgi:hypothetical protein
MVLVFAFLPVAAAIGANEEHGRRTFYTRGPGEGGLRLYTSMPIDHCSYIILWAYGTRFRISNELEMSLCSVSQQYPRLKKGTAL